MEKDTIVENDCSKRRAFQEGNFNIGTEYMIQPFFPRYTGLDAMAMRDNREWGIALEIIPAVFPMIHREIF